MEPSSWKRSYCNSTRPGGNRVKSYLDATSPLHDCYQRYITICETKFGKKDCRITVRNSEEQIANNGEQTRNSIEHKTSVTQNQAEVTRSLPEFWKSHNCFSLS